MPKPYVKTAGEHDEVDDTLLPKELCGWERQGYYYCRDHSPPGHGDEWGEIYATEVDAEHCAACGMYLGHYAYEIGMW